MYKTGFQIISLTIANAGLLQNQTRKNNVVLTEVEKIRITYLISSGNFEKNDLALGVPTLALNHYLLTMYLAQYDFINTYELTLSQITVDTLTTYGERKMGEGVRVRQIHTI